MRNQSGFSLVEVVLASMLAGMVLLAAFPLITAGRNLVEREQRKMEASLLGDRAFEQIYSELQRMNAEQVDDYICESTEINDLQTSFEKYGYDAVIEAEVLEDEWAFLGVKLMKEDVICYEREEVILLPNLELFMDTDEVEE